LHSKCDIDLVEIDKQNASIKNDRGILRFAVPIDA
jgi:hypothetical protein